MDTTTNDAGIVLLQAQSLALAELACELLRGRDVRGNEPGAQSSRHTLATPIRTPARTSIAAWHFGAIDQTPWPRRLATARVS